MICIPAAEYLSPSCSPFLPLAADAAAELPDQNMVSRWQLKSIGNPPPGSATVIAGGKELSIAVVWVGMRVWLGGGSCSLCL
jgi:hypothetical protein